MAYEIKDNSGSLFKNDKREKDSHPQARGSARINGVDYWISAWTKPTRDGDGKWQSLSFTPKDDQPRQPVKDAIDSLPDLDDEVPF